MGEKPSSLGHRTSSPLRSRLRGAPPPPQHRGDPGGSPGALPGLAAPPRPASPRQARPAPPASATGAFRERPRALLRPRSCSKAAEGPGESGRGSAMLRRRRPAPPQRGCGGRRPPSQGAAAPRPPAARGKFREIQSLSGSPRAQEVVVRE